MDCLVYYTTVFSVVTQRPKNSCVADYGLVDGTFFEPCVHEVHVQPIYVLRSLEWLLQQNCSFHGYFMHLAFFGTNVPLVVQPCNVFGHMRYTLPSVTAAYVTF